MRYNEHQAKDQEVPKKEKKENNLPKPGSYDSESLKNNNKNSHLWGR